MEASLSNSPLPGALVPREPLPARPRARAVALAGACAVGLLIAGLFGCCHLWLSVGGVLKVKVAYDDGMSLQAYVMHSPTDSVVFVEFIWMMASIC